MCGMLTCLLAINAIGNPATAILTSDQQREAPREKKGIEKVHFQFILYFKGVNGQKPFID